MRNQDLKEHLVNHVLLRVEMPAQYVGGELNMERKDPRGVRGRLCLAFPDAYTIGMSHHGLQVLYSLMNARDDWACERAYTPWPDMEEQLRQADVPLYSLETFTPLGQFDVLGFSLQYEVCYPSLLTMLDLGRIPLHGHQRTMADPLVTPTNLVPLWFLLPAMSAVRLLPRALAVGAMAAVVATVIAWPYLIPKIARSTRGRDVAALVAVLGALVLAGLGLWEMLRAS